MPLYCAKIFSSYRLIRSVRIQCRQRFWVGRWFMGRCDLDIILLLLPFTQHSSILALCRVQANRFFHKTTEVRTHELQPRSAPTILWATTTTTVWPTTIPVLTTTAVPTTAIWSATIPATAKRPTSVPTTAVWLRTIAAERLA